MKLQLDDGTTIAYDEYGSAGRDVLLTHGLGCDRTTLEAQVRHFKGDYRIVNMDFRGHGESDKPDQVYHPDVLAQDVAEVIDKLGLERPILIGHSLGGVVALRVSHLYPELLSGLIAMDSAWAVGEAVSAFTSALVDHYQQMDQDKYMIEVEAFIRNAFFMPSDDAVLRDEISSKMSTCPRGVFLSCWYTTVLETDTVGPLSELTMPTLYIAAQKANGDLDVIRQAKSVVIGQTVGSGHFIQAECADQVNSMIDRFLTVSSLR